MLKGLVSGRDCYCYIHSVVKFGLFFWSVHVKRLDWLNESKKKKKKKKK